MGKKILAAVIFVLLVSAIFAGCAGGYKYGPIEGEYKGTEVASNGGFVAQYGDYTYFINGIEYSYADNTFGKPVKAALMRVKTADIANEEAQKQIVVPRLMVSGTYKQGFFIDGDYVYYATPTTAKDKKGNVQSSYLDITRTKLDGTSTKQTPYMRLENNSTDYRFIRMQSAIYVVYVADNTLYSYNLSSDKRITLAKDASSYLIPSDLDNNNFYYTKNVPVFPDNEDSTQLHAFNEVYRTNADGSDNRLIISGLGVAREEDKDLLSPENKKITLIKAKDKFLYFTAVEEGRNSASAAYLLDTQTLEFSADGDAKEIQNFYKAQKIEDTTYLTAATIYNGVSQMFYPVSGTGIVRYDVDNDKSYAIYKNAADTITLLYIDGDYLYFSKASGAGNNLLRIDYTGEDSDYELYNSDKPAISFEQIGEIVYSGAWYLPEIINGNVFFASADDLGYNYVFVYELAKLNTEDYKHVFLGKRSQADQTSYETALEALEEEDK